MIEEWVNLFVELLNGESEEHVAFVKAVTLVISVTGVFDFDELTDEAVDLIQPVIRYRYKNGRPPILEMWKAIEAKLLEMK